MDDSGMEQSSVIAAFIKRFREAPPTSPNHRAAPKDKEAFWWLSKDIVTGVDGARSSRRTESFESGRSETPDQSDEDAAGKAGTEEGSSDESYGYGQNPLDISEEEVPRADIPVRVAPVALQDVKATTSDPIDGGRTDPAARVTAPVQAPAKSDARAVALAETVKVALPDPSCVKNVVSEAPVSIPDPFQEDDDFEFDFGMEELDARTNSLLQKCEEVLENFKTKPKPPENAAVVAPAIIHCAPMNHESFKVERNAVRVHESPVTPSKISSPVRGFRTGDESIFSLTSVLSEEDEVKLENHEIDETRSECASSVEPQLNHEDVVAGAEGKKPENSVAEAEENSLPPLRSISEHTPPRNKASRKQLTSPESVRSINGLSLENSGLFMFMSSSEEGTEDRVNKKSSTAPATLDSELSRSTASYSEDYHRLMTSLEGVEMLRSREAASKNRGSEHPQAMLRASKEYLKKSKNEEKVEEVERKSGRFALNDETVSPFLEDEIVRVLWKRLVAVRAELRRRAEY